MFNDYTVELIKILPNAKLFHIEHLKNRPNSTIYKLGITDDKVLYTFTPKLAFVNTQVGKLVI